MRAALRVEPSGADEGTCRVLLAVGNDGPAISPDAQKHVFERFYQADKSHATQGAGLGLPLVARVAELHNGSVCVESTPEGHATFTLALPA